MNEQTRPTLQPPVTESDHIQGNRAAGLTLVEYGDYECPHCARALPVVQELQRRLGDRLRVVFRHFPQNNIHPDAGVAAQAAEAAGAQGKFWEMHQLLYEHQQDLDLDYSRFAMQLGLEVYRFEGDLSSGTFARNVRRDYQSGLQSGVHATPTFFMNGVKYDGPPEPGPMSAALDAAGQE